MANETQVKQLLELAEDCTKTTVDHHHKRRLGNNQLRGFAGGIGPNIRYAQSVQVATIGHRGETQGISTIRLARQSGLCGPRPWMPLHRMFRQQRTLHATSI